MQIILGTHNAKKLHELQQWLVGTPITACSLTDFPNAIVVDETGTTFAQNAMLKAVQQAKHLQRWVLAEDSGIAVDAIDGRPSVYSARYAGPQANDEANNDHLLEALSAVPFDRRTAHYVCQLCLSDPEGTVRAEATGYCRGRIATARRGSNGFGYDPLFEVIEYHKTFGQLPAIVKRSISHRSRALTRLLPKLLQLHKRADELERGQLRRAVE
jgi:XTP/dITP diphosphohydrolase